MKIKFGFYIGQGRQQATPTWVALLFFVLSPSISFAADGYIVKFSSPTVYLDAGRSTGVQIGDSFVVYRPGEPLKHPMTGEVLGASEISLGSGVVQKIEDKFSVGLAIAASDAWKAGDRFRLEEKPNPTLEAAAAVVTGLPQELFRSAPMKGDPRGVAIGVSAQQPQVVVLFRDRIEVLSQNGNELKPHSTFSDRKYRNWMTVETGSDGKDGYWIYAGHYNESLANASTLVLAYQEGRWQPVGRIEGLVRSMVGVEGGRLLVSQGSAMSRELRVREPQQVVVENKQFRLASLPLPRKLSDDQWFGFTLGDWNRDQKDDLAWLARGETLKVQMGASETAWEEESSFGGTRNDFTYDLQRDLKASIFPRLLTFPAPDGAPLLLVPHNRSETGGLRLARVKWFKKSSLTAFRHTKTGFDAVWTLPLQGYLADAVVSDQLLWTLLGTDRQSVVVAHSLPK